MLPSFHLSGFFLKQKHSMRNEKVLDVEDGEEIKQEKREKGSRE
jgi:hypothetical protein